MLSNSGYYLVLAGGSGVNYVTRLTASNDEHQNGIFSSIDNSGLINVTAWIVTSDAVSFELWGWER